MNLIKSIKLMQFLPDINRTASALEENGYKDILKTITKDCYIVSAVSKFGTKLTELWDAVKNVHILKSEMTFGEQVNIDEIIREKLDGTSFRFYGKSVKKTPDYEETLLYSDTPTMVYRRFFDKVLNKIEYFKMTGDGQWKQLCKKSAVNAPESTKASDGLRIRHSVRENDGSVSTYLLNPKTQCLYKKNITIDGNAQYYKVTPRGVINLFSK